MAFCTKCGFNLTEGTKFCPNCGQGTNASVGYNTPPQYVQVVKPIIPGRGFGVASMVLGIIGLFYAFVFMLMGVSLVAMVFGEGEYMPQGLGIAFAIYIAMISTLSILAWVFSVSSRKRGYVNGISKSGLIMGVIGVCAYFVAAVLCIAASSV